MTANPFVYDRPLPPGEGVDRPAQREQLVALANGGQSSRLAAARRYGKTTLLGDVAAQLRGEGWVVCLADLSSALSVEAVCERLGRAWREALDRPGLKRVLKKVESSLTASFTGGVPGVAQVQVARHPAAERTALERLSELLDVPTRLAGERDARTLVVFDEFQDLLAAGEGLDGLIRSHVQHHLGVASYCFAGSQASLLDELFTKRARPLFGQARPVSLAPVPTEALAGWIEARFAAHGRELAPEVARALAAGADGHPQRAALVTYALWEQPRLDAAALQAAEDEALRIAQGEVEQAFSALSSAERRIVGEIARGTKELFGAEALQRMGLGKGTVRDRRRALLREAVLQDRDGTVAITDPFLVRWARERTR